MATPMNTNLNQLNELLETVVNKIGRQDWASKAYLNPLKKFKKGFIANANEIEEIVRPCGLYRVLYRQRCRSANRACRAVRRAPFADRHHANGVG